LKIGEIEVEKSGDWGGGGLGAGGGGGGGAGEGGEFRGENLADGIGETDYHGVGGFYAEFAGDVDVVVVGRDGDVGGPGVFGAAAVAVGVLAAGQAHVDGLESEFLGVVLDDGPAFVGRGGGGEMLLESLEREVGVERPAECAFDKHTAEHSELDVTEVLDADPGDKAEGDDDEAGEVGIHHEQRGDGAEGAEAVEDEGGSAGGESTVEEAVVDVAAIGLEDGFAAEEAANDGEDSIDQGDGEGHERRRHADDGGGFLTPEDAVAAEEEADEEAAGIAEEDGGGVEVIAEEAEEGPGEGAVARASSGES